MINQVNRQQLTSLKTPPSAAPHRGLGSQPQRREDKKTKSKKHRASKNKKI